MVVHYYHLRGCWPRNQYSHTFCTLLKLCKSVCASYWHYIRHSWRWKDNYCHSFVLFLHLWIQNIYFCFFIRSVLKYEKIWINWDFSVILWWWLYLNESQIAINIFYFLQKVCCSSFIWYIKCISKKINGWSSNQVKSLWSQWIIYPKHSFSPISAAMFSIQGTCLLTLFQMPSWKPSVTETVLSLQLYPAPKSVPETWKNCKYFYCLKISLPIRIWWVGPRTTNGPPESPLQGSLKTSLCSSFSVIVPNIYLFLYFLLFTINSTNCRVSLWASDAEKKNPLTRNKQRSLKVASDIWETNKSY